jgi:Xaa-Pro dipeptidase
MTLMNAAPISKIYSDRQDKLASILSDANLDSLILNPGPSLVYLTGLHFHLMERPVLVYFTPGNPPTIVLPELELEKIRHLPFTILSFPYGEDPSSWGETFQNALVTTNLANKRNGVESKQLRLLEYNYLIESGPNAQFLIADNNLSNLRIKKDEGELFAMRKAVEIAQNALSSTLHHFKIGMTERELAAELMLQLFRAGADPEMPFSPIVSGGPNAANPHATPSDRKLSPGDLLVIDWGASNNGYISDITRTFAIGKPDSEFEKIGNIVYEANAAGRAAAGPGVPAELVDQATRKVIESSGYGKFFTHRTGHGIGMEGHEDPYIRAGNLLELEPGMTFTVEPGIYLPGRNGVRIEDDVVVTESGAESLTDLPREVMQIA